MSLTGMLFQTTKSSIGSSKLVAGLLRLVPIRRREAASPRRFVVGSSLPPPGKGLMMPENPIDAYLAAVPEERRPVLEVLRQRIRAIAPDAEEVTSYGIPAFRVEGKVVIGFRANRSDYSIYPFSGGAAQRFPEELQGRTVTSGSIHFTAEDPISDDLLRRIIEWRIQASRKRGGSRLEAPMKGEPWKLT
jgi:uncharacterized protein YdhG (YjbR/CyaY superfamily)